MKTIAYTALLYGKSYLAYAIRSVIDHVDEIHVIYTPTGSHGHATNEPCPETRDELYAIADAAATWKLHWHDAGTFLYEGQQRESIHHYAPDADIIVTLDYDEIWQPGLIEHAIETAANSNVRAWRVPFRHYWRSFRRCVLHDPAYPDRVFNMRAGGGNATLDGHGLAINHMGYAIPVDLMRWKWKVHGHKNELRRDVDFFRDIYEANRQHDCHPVGSLYWNPETVDPLDYMPMWMQGHPYYGLDVIP